MKESSSLVERLGLVGQSALVGAVTAAAADEAGWDLAADRPADAVMSAGKAVLARVSDLAGQVMVTDVIARDRLPVADDADVAAGLFGLSQSLGRMEALMVAFVVQAHERRAYAETGLSLHDWLATRCLYLSRGQIDDLVVLATSISVGGVFPSKWAAAYGPLTTALQERGLSLRRAAKVVRTAVKVRPVFDTIVEFTAFIESLVAVALRGDVTDHDLDRLAKKIVTTALPPKDKECREKAARLMRSVTEVELAEGEVVRFTVTTDAAGAATIRAVLSSPLAAPVPDPILGMDERSAGQRRHDALLTVIGRGVASAEGVPTTEKAKVIITIDWDVLLERVNGAGLTATGEVLSPAAVRRLACGAGVLPMVLGTGSVPLDMGRETRLATPSQLKALWVRDEGCSFPGCTIPPGWCDAHHILWWGRGGRTDLDQLALLCGRHHTIVHDKDLAATLVDGHVYWHL